MVYIKYDPNKNLPTREAILYNQRQKQVKTLASGVCVTNKSRQNLTPSQKQLLRWHFRLEHIEFQYVQWLVSTRRMKVKINAKAAANCESTKCAACEFVKGSCQPNKVNTIQKNPMKQKDLNTDHILPGQMVYSYQYILLSPGSLYRIKGESYIPEMFSGRYYFI